MSSNELIQLATQALALPVSAGILLNGVEELLIDAQYFARGLHRREHCAITVEQLADAPSRRIAIMVAAWQEADVIESMLEHNRRTLDYDPACFHFFCGTYQNDPDTQRRVTAVAQRHSNVHKVVVPHDGPTSKADCLNWIYQGIVLHEKRTGERFDILLMHDAEDLIHPLALRLYSLLIPANDFVQTPVFSLPLRKRNIVAGTYIDEFAEHHLKDMLVREAMGGLVPSAGVGSAFSRDAFEEIATANDQLPFNVDSLTEDYEVGLKFRLAGKRVHFACRSLQRTRTVKRWFGRGEREVIEEEFIATREYFPGKLRGSVRQRARWITGIALQTWRQIGWQGPAAVRYCLWRDRKVVWTNSLLLFAYCYIALATALAAFTPINIGTFVPPGSALWWMMCINLFLLGWRATMKMTCVGRLYGYGHALVSLPRLIVMNLIGLAATARAVRQYISHLWTGKPLRWAKTAHEFPNSDILAAHQRRLGEFLVECGRLTSRDLEDALRIQVGTQLRLGEVISASGMMTARAVAEALGANHSIPYSEPIADEVPLSLLGRLPEQVAVELGAMPVSIGDDGCAVVAMCSPPTAAQTQRLGEALGGPVRIVLAERQAIRRGRWRAYRRVGEVFAPRRRLGEALLEDEAVDLDQLHTALEEQLETGERLGELLIRRGIVTAELVAKSLGAPRGSYRAVAAADVDTGALTAIGYGLSNFYQLAPLRSLPNLLLASPFPIHREVINEVARRVGRPVESVLATSLDVRVAIAIASRSAWPLGVALSVPGLDGEELSAVMSEPALVADVATLASAANENGRSPIDHLLSTGGIGQDRAMRLRARALGLQVEAPANCVKPTTDLLPPELVAQHSIRLCAADVRGLVLAAPNPTPLLAQQVAQLFIHRAIAWRVVVEPAEPATLSVSAQPSGLREAVV